MEHDEPISLGQGVLLALTRDDSKALFACRTDEALLEFLQDRFNDSDWRKEGRLASCDGVWRTLHACLTCDSVEAEANRVDQAIGQCLLGGRKLYRGDDHIVALIRPDMVPHIASALAEMTQEELRGRLERSETSPNERALASSWKVVERLREFYALAANAGNAVVFSAAGSYPIAGD